MRILFWIVFSLLTVLVGFYPFSYFIFDMSGGFPSIKSPELLQSMVWNASFYLHISFGGIALLSGLSQFSSKVRRKKVKLHRLLGKIYLICVIVSGVAGLYMSFFATGGLVSAFGFGGLALVWLFTSFQAYHSIRNGKVDQHQQWMIRSYALCWGAVTLRLWAPILQFGLGMEFIAAYRILAWINWLNLFAAEIIIRNLKKKKTQTTARVVA